MSSPTKPKLSVLSVPVRLLLALGALLFFFCQGICINAFQSPEPNTYTKWLARRQQDQEEKNVSLRQDSAVSNRHQDQVSSYRHVSYLGENKEVALHWSIDEVAAVIHLATAVEATGWVAFGISEVGGMPGSDMFLFESLKPGVIVDVHATAYARPLVDNHQDWTLVSSTVEDGFIIVEVKRSLDTGDRNDRPIESDLAIFNPGTSVIAAWGATNQMHYHGPNRAKGEVRFFQEEEKPSFEKVMASKAEGYVDITFPSFVVPAQRTTYQRTCLTMEDIGLSFDTELHVIGFDILLASNASASTLLHHMLLYSSTSRTKPAARRCSRKGAQNYMIGWGKGGQKNMMVPDHVGFLAGGTDHSAIGSFRLEVHYDNPFMKKGATTGENGLRLYYTSKLRPSHVSVLALGDVKIAMLGQHVGGGLVKHAFTCPDTCSSQNLPEEGVTVFAESLHMHQTGMRMVNQQIRNGVEIRRGEVQYWDFDQTSSFRVKQESFVVKPGDAFITTCYYNATNSTMFGFASDDEMCFGFLHFSKPVSASGISMECHYKGNIKGCGASHLNSSVDEVNFGRIFGTIPIQPPETDDSLRKSSIEKKAYGEAKHIESSYKSEMGGSNYESEDAVGFVPLNAVAVVGLIIAVGYVSVSFVRERQGGCGGLLTSNVKLCQE